VIPVDYKGSTLWRVAALDPIPSEPATHFDVFVTTRKAAVGHTEKRNLRREDWLRMGLEALAEGGSEELKATRLARRVGVTTGSFYWHFKCLADFRLDLLGYWKENVIVGLISAAREAAEDDEQVLSELRRLILETGAHRYDAAMREWAATDPSVQEAVADADQLRAEFIAQQFRKAGLKPEAARDRATLAGAAWRGLQGVVEAEDRMRLIGLVGGLRGVSDN
jgi:AcrR family transcriptional regulator